MPSPSLRLSLLAEKLRALKLLTGVGSFMVKCQLERAPLSYRHSVARDWPQWERRPPCLHTFRMGPSAHGRPGLCTQGSVLRREVGSAQASYRPTPAVDQRPALACRAGFLRPATPEEACCTAAREGARPSRLSLRLCRGRAGLVPRTRTSVAGGSLGRAWSSWPCHGSPQDPGLETDA